MASKKNPLANLLQTDSRAQASPFSRDYNPRSTVRQAGTYGISITPPVPLSQTSMGRLSKSLAGTSAVLRELDNYQTQKEEIESRKEVMNYRVESAKIAGEKALIDLDTSKLRGAIANETVKQQAIQLEAIQEQKELFDFEETLSGKTPEERKAFLAEMAALGKKADLSVDLSLTAVEKASTVAAVEQRNNPNPSAEREEQAATAPALASLARRRQGESFFPEFKAFFDEQSEALFNTVDNPFLTREEAENSAESLLSKFVKDNQLEGDVKKGFVKATYPAFKKASDVLIVRMLDKSENIKNDLLRSSVQQSAVNDSPLDEIQLGSLQALEITGKLVSFLGGGEGTMGLLGLLAGGDGEYLENFSEVILKQLGEKLTFEGRPFKESEEFSRIRSDFNKAVEKNADQEVADADEARKRRDQKTSDKLATLNEGLTEEKARDLSIKVTSENFTTLFPTLEEDYAEVPEEQQNSYLNSVKFTLEKLSSEKQERYAAYIKKHTENYIRLDTAYGAMMTLNFLQTTVFDDTEGVVRPAKGTLSQYYKEGANFTAMELELLNGVSGGLFDDYKKGVDQAAKDNMATFGTDIGSKEARKSLKDTLQTLDDNLKTGLTNFIKKRYTTKMKAVAELEEGFEDISTILSAKRNRYRNMEKMIAEESFSPARLAARRKELGFSILDPQLRTKEWDVLAEHAAHIVNDNEFPFNLNQSKQKENYEKLHEETEELELARYSAGITGKNIIEIAQTASFEGKSERITIVTVEDQVDWDSVDSRRLTNEQRRMHQHKPLEERRAAIRQEAAANLDRLKPLTVSRAAFGERNIPVVGLLFDREPESQQDVELAARQLRASPEELKMVAKLFGHKNVISFLKAQYDGDYQTQLRKTK